VADCRPVDGQRIMNRIDRIRIAVVGLGARGQFHLEALLLREDCEVVLAVDPLPAHRDRWRGRVPRLEAALEPSVLQSARVQAVWLATPESALPELIQLSVRERCGIVLEPWLEDHDGEVDRLLAWGGAAGCPIVVHLPHRVIPEFRQTLQVRESGRLGQLRSISRSIWQLAPASADAEIRSSLARQLIPWLDQARTLAGGGGSLIWSRREVASAVGGPGDRPHLVRPGGLEILLDFGPETVVWLDLQWQTPAAWDSGWRLRGTEGVWQPTGGTVASPAGELLEFRAEEMTPDSGGVYDAIMGYLLGVGPNPGEWRGVSSLSRLAGQILNQQNVSDSTL
jgi:predicted dehydrogenase